MIMLKTNMSLNLFHLHQNAFNSNSFRLKVTADEIERKSKESCCRQNLSKLSQSQDLPLVSSSSANKKGENWENKPN